MIAFFANRQAEMGHIQLARTADLVVVAPATASFMARANAGIADDLATTILLATKAAVMAPAMILPCGHIQQQKIILSP